MLLLPLLLACSGDPGAGAFTAEASISETMGTVVKVSWEELGAEEVIIEYGHGEVFDRSRLVPAGESETLLLGLKPDSDVQLKVVQRVDGEVLESDTLQLATDPLDAGLPSLNVQAAEPGALDNGLVLATLIQNPTSVLVFDGDGDVVWWKQMIDDDWVGRSRLSHDGQHILVQPLNREGEEGHGLSRLDLEGNEVSVDWIANSHHDFDELPDGTLAFLVNEAMTYEGAPVLGDAIVELAPDGTETRVFSAFDAFEYTPELDTLDGPEWSHANSISYVPDQDAYYVSFYGLGGIAKIARSTGEMEWMFGGYYGDWTDEHGNRNLLDIQHGFEVLDDSLLIFENSRANSQSSRAVEYSLDESTMVTHLLWAYEPDPSVYTPSLGNVDRLDNGNTIVNFSAGGLIVEVDPEGNEIWRLASGLGGAFGYSTWEDDLYADQ